MMSWGELYHVLSNVVPLYFGLILGYVSLKWLEIFTPDQCAGISLFVGKFAVPILCLDFVSNNNIYAMDFRFLAADTLQKIIVLIVLIIWWRFTTVGSLEWCITLFSVAALPSIIVMGVPLLDVMYGKITDSLLAQTVLMQYLIWFPFMLFLLEFRAAKLSTANPLPSDKPLTSVRIELSNVNNNASGADNSSFTTILRSLSDPSFNRGSTSYPQDYNDTGAREFGTRNRPEGEIFGQDSTLERSSATNNPNVTVKTSHILAIVGKKLLKNPNTYASVIGLIWSLIAFRWHLKMPEIVSGSIKIFSNGALGIAMFSLGLFMAAQPKLFACGKTAFAIATAMKFIVGPVIMGAVSLALGLKGTVLHIAIVQAALPLGIVTFVFAETYNVHPGIQSTGVIFGMLIALPVTLVYHILLGT